MDQWGMARAAAQPTQQQQQQVQHQQAAHVPQVNATGYASEFFESFWRFWCFSILNWECRGWKFGAL